MNYVTDISIEENFYDEYANAPEQVQNAVDKIIRMVTEAGEFPPAFRPHRAKGTVGLWIGHVTRVGEHWRLLYFHDSNHVTFKHLVNKATEKRLLRAYSV